MNAWIVKWMIVGEPNPSPLEDLEDGQLVMVIDPNYSQESVRDIMAFIRMTRFGLNNEAVTYANHPEIRNLYLYGNDPYSLTCGPHPYLTAKYATEVEIFTRADGREYLQWIDPQTGNKEFAIKPKEKRLLKGNI